MKLFVIYAEKVNPMLEDAVSVLAQSKERALEIAINETFSLKNNIGKIEEVDLNKEGIVLISCG